MSLRVDSSTDSKWFYVPVFGEPFPNKEQRVKIDREVLNLIMQDDPRPPDMLLDIIGQRAVKRMPVPNSEDGTRLITPHNLELVWPK